jgi:hypothetical protein
MQSPKTVVSCSAVVMLAICLGYTSLAFAQQGCPADTSSTVTLLERIDSTSSQSGHQ